VKKTGCIPDQKGMPANHRGAGRRRSADGSGLGAKYGAAVRLHCGEPGTEGRCTTGAIAEPSDGRPGKTRRGECRSHRGVTATSGRHTARQYKPSLHPNPSLQCNVPMHAQLHQCNAEYDMPGLFKMVYTVGQETSMFHSIESIKHAGGSAGSIESVCTMQSVHCWVR
jgi:hypothetical protein